MSETETMRIVLKNPHGNVLETVSLPSIELLRKLRKTAGSKDKPLSAHLVFRGRVLADDWLTLEEAFEGIKNPVVYVVERKLKDKQETPLAPVPSSSGMSSPVVRENRASEERVRETRHVDHQADEPRCRICYSSENEPSDRLFRPCMCRGTVGMVHMSCLNAWRERPENPDAYFRCANCGYEYRISRARFAQLLTSEEYAKVGAVFYMLAIVIFVSMLSMLIFPAVIANTFFDLIEWTPPDAEYPVVRHLVFGVSCLGLAGFLTHLAELVEFAREHGNWETAFALGLALTSNGKRGIRIFCACGIAVAYRLIYRESQRLVRRLFAEFGERVLAVGE